MNDRFKLRFWDKKEKEYFTCGDIDYKSEILKTYPYRTYNWCFEHKNIIAEQCTGLKDKNGKLIYEGDILNSLYRSDGCEGLYKIVWCEGRLLPEKIGNHQQKQVTVHLTDLKWCEIIGNIHENADLLELKQDDRR